MCMSKCECVSTWVCTWIWVCECVCVSVPVYKCVVSVHVHMCECACMHKCEQVCGDPAEGGEDLQESNRKCTVWPSKFSSNIFTPMHSSLQTRVVPELVIVHPGHSVHQKITNETLEGERKQLSEKYFLKVNKKLLPLSKPLSGESGPVPVSAQWPHRWGGSAHSHMVGAKWGQPAQGCHPGRPHSSHLGLEQVHLEPAAL